MVKHVILPNEIQEMHLPEYLIEDICLLIQAREKYQKNDSVHNHSAYMHH